MGSTNLMNAFPEIRVLVVADNLLARVGLAAMINQDSSLNVVGQVSGEDNLDADLVTYQPDVVLIDLGYDVEPMLPMLQTLIEAELPQVVMLPDTSSINTVLPVLNESGSFALLLREGDLDLLPDAIRSVMAGLVVFDPALVTAIMPETPLDIPPLLEDLTPREMEVLELLARGMTNKAIGQQLAISLNTVKFHVNAILNKFNAQSRTEAVVRATQLGLLVL